MFARAFALATLAALCLTLGAQDGSASQQKSSSPAPKAPPAAKAAKDTGGGLSGKVVETMNGGGYTYVCLEKNGSKTWVAVPEMKVKVGSTMSFEPGSVMNNFESKTLKRTFETIIFSPGPASAGKPSGGAPQGHAGSKAQVASLEKGAKVEKAAGPDAYTVSELYAKSAKLDKKSVVVRGKVVKVSRGIMGKNWIHIQDGSGDQAKGTHNVVATSQEDPAVGDVVTVRGTLAKDRDFGGGYLYKVILEESAVQK